MKSYRENNIVTTAQKLRKKMPFKVTLEVGAMRKRADNGSYSYFVKTM